MPTGYTADVANGKVTDFRTFALRCARQFGATIMQRDEPMDVLPKLREKSDFYEKALADAQSELARFRQLTPSEAEAEQEREYLEQVKLRNRVRQDNHEKRERYVAMLAQVNRWSPPTGSHYPMKEFMVKQLEESIRFDCNDEWPIERSPIDSTAAWLEEKVARAQKSANRYEEEVENERARVAGANAWIQALWKSLPDSPEKSPLDAHRRTQSVETMNTEPTEAS